MSLLAGICQVDIDSRISRMNIFGERILPDFDAAPLQAITTSTLFFANALNTRTRSLNMVACYASELGREPLRYLGSR